MNIKLSIC